MKQKNQNNPSIERRFTVGEVELRAEEGKPTVIRGYAALFGVRSSNLGGFIEVIEPGAFDGVLLDDIRALFNHDSNLILARSKNGSGTLKVGTDQKGLWYEFQPDEGQSYAADLVRAMKRGDVDQSSFAFSVARDGQAWEDSKDGEKFVTIRTIKKVAKLYDVSPVTYPAYPDTTVATRSLEEYRKDHPDPENPPAPPSEEEARRRQLELAEAE
ncbi:MAG: HK97 family phage prohead protease [Cephaloticoccus sp.]|nr:HK97 family phage prohead protease [Cephaloticoccus sp.]